MGQIPHMAICAFFLKNKYWILEYKGIGQSNLWEELAYTRKNYSINLLALLETKTSKQPSVQNVKTAGFNNFFMVPATGTRGGILMLWNDKLNSTKFKIQDSNPRWIVTSYKDTNTDCYIIFVYAPSREEEKPYFWEDFSLLISSLSEPVIIAGDLNEIEFSEDKSGGASPSQNRF